MSATLFQTNSEGLCEGEIFFFEEKNNNKKNIAKRLFFAKKGDLFEYFLNFYFKKARSSEVPVADVVDGESSFHRLSFY
jgi:hypothetical protein